MADRDGPWDGSDDEPHLELEVLACPTCRRELHPWESECPDCREPAVLRYSLPPGMPRPPAHLLDDPRTVASDGTGPSGEEAESAALIDRAFAVTEAETREPLDDDLPQPPPVGGDPHFD